MVKSSLIYYRVGFAGKANVLAKRIKYVGEPDWLAKSFNHDIENYGNFFFILSCIRSYFLEYPFGNVLISIENPLHEDLIIERTLNQSSD